jgi:hypothetical protein
VGEEVLVFARQGRAGTLVDGLLDERLLLDGYGVGKDHGVVVIVESEYFRCDSFTIGIAFAAITVYHDAHCFSFAFNRSSYNAG